MKGAEVRERLLLNAAFRWKSKVKQSHNRPGQALRVPGGWGCQISRRSAHEGGRVVSPTHRPPSPPGNILLEADSTPGPYQWQILMIASGIEPATCRLVVQCASTNCATKCPPSDEKNVPKFWFKLSQPDDYFT
jgi:hypothetical protein